MIDINLNGSIIFCGAGISRNSGLPTVFDFYNSLFELLKPKVHSPLELAQIVIEKQLPFEEIVEILFSELDSYDFLDIFSTGTPNTNHLLFASLLNKGLVHQVVTTNFDCLIEDALAAISPAFSYSKKYQESDFEQLVFQDQSLLKLHGSIEGENFNELKATIGKVANEKWLGIIGETVNYIFHDGPHDSVIVMGYSFSDKFDINPHIFNNNKSSKKIYIINHHDSFSLTDLKESDTIFKGENFEGAVINIQTDEFTKQLWEQNLGTKYPGAKQSRSPWKSLLKTHFNSVSIALKQRILGLIYKELGDLNNALDCLKESQNKLSDDHRNLKLQGRNALMIGNILEYQNHLSKAKLHYDTSISIGQDINDQILISDSKFHLGRYFEKKNQFDQALEYYQQSVNLDPSDRSKAKTFHQIGIVYQETQELDKARDKYEAALSLYKANGDFRGLTKANHQIGNIRFLQKNYDQAKLSYEENIEACEKIANIQDKGRSIYMLGLTEKQLGNLTRAERLFRDSLEIKKDFSEKQGIAMNLNQLGDVFLLQENFNLAKDYFDQAFEHSKKHELKRETSSSLFFKSMLLQKTNQHLASINTAKKALDISLELKWDYHTTRLYQLLIQLYDEIGDDSNLKYFNGKLKELTGSL